MYEGAIATYFKGILGTVIALPIAINIISWMGSIHTTDEASMMKLFAVIGIPALTSLFVVLKKILNRCSEREIAQLRNRTSFEKILTNKIKPEEKAKIETILEPVMQEKL